MKLGALVRALSLAFGAFVLASGAFGQTTGTIRGTVTDPSDLVVAGAKVTVTLQETGVTRSNETNGSGDYDFPALPVGHYTVEVETKGFKTFLQNDIDVSLGHVVVINVGLELGEVTQVVTTTAEAPLVETTSTQLGVVEGAQRVTQLPLNERDTYQLLQLQPGVSSQVGSDLFLGSDRAGVVSVNGGRGRSNNFMVNGGDANDQFVNLPAVQPSPDTIQEFRVLTNTFDAEFGRNSGSVVNVVTKSGTNQFHASAYEFLRNRALNARGFFDAERADFKMNQFGSTIGGPIRKDRHFFFASYEGRRIRQGTPSEVVTVPSVAERSGDFSGGSNPGFTGTLGDQTVADLFIARPGCATAVANQGGAPIAPGTDYSSIFPNNVIPPECFDPTAKALLDNFVPLPNRGGDQLQTIPVSSTRFDQFTVRTDHRINDQQQISVYYYFTDDNIVLPFSRLQAGGANVPGFGSAFKDRYQQVNATHTWVINPTTVNELRATYFRQGQKTFNHPLNTSLILDSCGPSTPPAPCFSDPNNPRLGITPGLGAEHEGVPFIAISGGFNVGNNFEGELPQVGNTYQLANNFTKVMGNHTVKFGGDFRRQQFNQFLFFDVNGTFDFFGGGPNDPGFGELDQNGELDSQSLLPNYLLGLPDDFLQGAAQLEAVRSTSYYLYGQDSWKIRPNLTLNYGLRWELNTPLHDKFNRVQTFRPGQPTTLFPCQLGASIPAATANPLIQDFGTSDCGPGSAGESVFPLGLVVPGDQGVPPGLTQTYKKSFAPRIGIAWSPGDSGKTSIRAGFGLFYNPVEQLILEQFSAEPPFGGSTFVANNFFNTPFLGQDGTVFPNPFSGILNPQSGQAVDWSLFRPILLFGQFQPKQRSQYAEQYNLTIQHEIKKDLVLQVAYVGSQGHRLFISRDLNPGNAQTCLDLENIAELTGNGDLSCGPFFADSSFFVPAGTIPAGVTLNLPYGSVSSVTGPNNPDITLVGLRPFSSPLCEPTTGKGCAPDGIPPLSSIFTQDTIANSNYNSFQLLVEKRFSKGLQFTAAYTWSKSFDWGSSFEDILNPTDFSRSYALSQFNSKHRFVFSYYWELPVPQYHGVAGKLANGWAVSGITTFQSGFPVRITTEDDIELQNSFDFVLPGEPDLLQPFRTFNPRNDENRSFDSALFGEPALGTIGSSPRTLCCGPPIQNFDMAFLKETSITERVKMQFRAEFFNIFNRAQFLNPDGNITDGDEFGTVKRVRDPRLIQFALKLNF